MVDRGAVGGGPPVHGRVHANLRALSGRAVLTVRLDSNPAPGREWARVHLADVERAEDSSPARAWIDALTITVEGMLPYDGP